MLGLVHVRIPMLRSSSLRQPPKGEERNREVTDRDRADEQRTVMSILRPVVFKHIYQDFASLNFFGFCCSEQEFSLGTRATTHTPGVCRRMENRENSPRIDVTPARSEQIRPSTEMAGGRPQRSGRPARCGPIEEAMVSPAGQKCRGLACSRICSTQIVGHRRC